MSCVKHGLFSKPYNFIWYFDRFFTSFLLKYISRLRYCGSPRLRTNYVLGGATRPQRLNPDELLDDELHPALTRLQADRLACARLATGFPDDVFHMEVTLNTK